MMELTTDSSIFIFKLEVCAQNIRPKQIVKPDVCVLNGILGLTGFSYLDQGQGWILSNQLICAQGFT